jgi:signal transduction histidine kinase
MENPIEQNEQSIHEENDQKTLNENQSGGMFQDLRSSSNEIIHLESEMRMSLEEIARLQNALADANMKLAAMQAFPGKSKSEVSGDDYLKPLLKELRQPINTIKGYLDLLSNESVGSLGTFQKRFVERILNSVYHMENLIREHEKPVNNMWQKGNLFASYFSVATLLEKAISLFTDQIRIKHITLRVEFPESEITVFGDSEILDKTLNILFSNAVISANDESILKITLEEEKSRNDDRFCVSIRSCDIEKPEEAGIPINIEQYKNQDLILQGFSSTIRELNLAKNQIENISGTFEVISFAGNGSLVKFHVPVDFHHTQDTFSSGA